MCLLLPGTAQKKLHHTIQFKATDQAGNVTETPIQEFFVEQSAAGMRAALPYVSTFAWAGDPAGFARLAETVALR